MDKALPPFGVTAVKPFPPKNHSLKPSKIVKIWTFHVYLLEFLNVS